jgi:hypothetical protein
MQRLFPQTFILAAILVAPCWLDAGRLGQGPIDYSKRAPRISGNMYGGSIYKGTRMQSQKSLRFGMSRNNSSISRFNRSFHAPGRTLRYNSYVLQDKRSIWSRLKSGLFKKRETKMMDTGLFKHSGLNTDSRRLSQFQNAIRIDNRQKGTRRISAGDINQFIDPRSNSRAKGGIPVQGPVEVIPIK